LTGKRAAIILAGGRSSRMGENKALMMLDTKTMLGHIEERVSRVTDNIVIVIGSRQNVGQFRDASPTHVSIIKDIIDVKSPLVGILTGTKFLSAAYVSIHPCDTPLLEPSLIRYLFDRAEGHDAAIAVTKGGRLQPLNSVYSASAVGKACKESLSGGGLRCTEMIQRLHDVIYVNDEDLVKFDPHLRTYLNVNTKQEFDELRSMLNIREQGT